MSRSQYADRDTVGTIALKARDFHHNPVAGDLGHELMPGLVEDLNNTFKSDPFDGKPFYVIIHEKKDALLTNLILRRMLVSEKRPYPETNTTVFWTNPKSQEVRFCWCLPHKATFIEYLTNPHKYDKELIEDIKNYKVNNMERFGFRKIDTRDKVDYYKPIEGFQDRKLRNKPSFLIAT